jgi:hypothetical protein
MAQYVDPLIRSGAMWSCGRQRGMRSHLGWWSRMWNWLGGTPPAAPRVTVCQAPSSKPDKPWC